MSRRKGADLSSRPPHRVAQVHIYSVSARRDLPEVLYYTYPTGLLRRPLGAAHLFSGSRSDRFAGYGISVGPEKGNPMIDPDVMTMLILLMAVLIVLLIPPGPGTPLRSPVPSR